MTKYHLTVAAILCVAGFAAPTLKAVDVSDISIHGSVSDSLSESDKYNFYGDTANGKFDDNIRELTLNGSYRWASGLRVSAQLYASDVDGYQALDLDFLSLDYQFKPWFGIRLGRNKSSLGLYGDSQDLDQVRTFANLPFGFYPRNRRQLNYTDGAAFYGSVTAAKAGSFDYNLNIGRIENVKGDALIARSSGGLTQVDQFGIPLAAIADLIWNTPVDGLRFGTSALEIPHIADKGQLATKAFATQPGLGYDPTPLGIDALYGNGAWNSMFAGQPANTTIGLDEYTGSVEYSTGKWIFAAEYEYQPEHTSSSIPALGVKGQYSRSSEVDSYVQATYQATKPLGVGAYFDYTNTNQHGTTPAYYRLERDAAGVVSYALTSWWLVKVEFHEMNGLGLVDSAGDLNPNAPTAGQHWNYLVFKTTLSF